jgi:putative methyltransferase (TIGR04325 family)
VTAREWLCTAVPPALLDAFRRRTGRHLRFAGHPASWEDAARRSGGYSATHILDTVTDATRAVISGAARWERDGVLLNDADPPFAVLTALWRAARLANRNLEVVDFGGSLGSTYRQCRPLLEGIGTLRWRVIEQAAFVQRGQTEFSTPELSFHVSADCLPTPEGARAVLASSVLQYLAEPFTVLDSLTRIGARHMIIDRTPMHDGTVDRLCIQHVPRHIYEASYPCRLLSRPRLLTYLQRHWRLVSDFPCAEGRRRTDDGMQFEYRGLILDRLETPHE